MKWIIHYHNISTSENETNSIVNMEFVDEILWGKRYKKAMFEIPVCVVFVYN